MPCSWVNRDAHKTQTKPRAKTLTDCPLVPNWACWQECDYGTKPFLCIHTKGKKSPKTTTMQKHFTMHVHARQQHFLLYGVIQPAAWPLIQFDDTIQRTVQIYKSNFSFFHIKLVNMTLIISLIERFLLQTFPKNIVLVFFFWYDGSDSALRPLVISRELHDATLAANWVFLRPFNPFCKYFDFIELNRHETRSSTHSFSHSLI